MYKSKYINHWQIMAFEKKLKFKRQSATIKQLSIYRVWVGFSLNFHDNISVIYYNISVKELVSFDKQSRECLRLNWLILICLFSFETGYTGILNMKISDMFSGFSLEADFFLGQRTVSVTLVNTHRKDIPKRPLECVWFTAKFIFFSGM